MFHMLMQTVKKVIPLSAMQALLAKADTVDIFTDICLQPIKNHSPL